MAIYLFAYAIYFGILSIGLQRKNTRGWVVTATLPMFAMVWLRGGVGVDLPMYIQFIELSQQSEGYNFLFEPGFELLVNALGYITDEPMIAINLIATITTLLLLKTKWQTRTAYQTLSLAIIPYFYLDMTMNGLRYGLAFAIILASLNSFLAKQQFRFASSALIATSVQVSSFYLSGILKILLRPSWKYLLFMIFVVSIVVFIGLEYFTLKTSNNAELSKPGITAGVAPLFLSLLVLTACWNTKNIRKVYKNKLIILFCLSFSFYGLTQITYAGLRFQQLNYFFILVFLIFISESMKLKKANLILVSLILVAILGSAFRLNNFYSEAGLGDTPFVPYKFYWAK